MIDSVQYYLHKRTKDSPCQLIFQFFDSANKRDTCVTLAKEHTFDEDQVTIKDIYNPWTNKNDFIIFCRTVRTTENIHIEILRTLWKSLVVVGFDRIR